jgi:HTH-type transcriptional regulator / antitoxin HigA
MDLSKEFISPGEAIKHFLDKKNWTQEDFAQIISISPKHANELIKNKKPLSLELIIDISNAFSFEEETRQSFIKLYTNYRVKTIDASNDNLVRDKAELFGKYPISEMIKKGWIEKTNDYNSLVEQCKKVLNIGSIQAIDSLNYNLHFRKSENNNFEDLNAKIWRKVAETKAQKVTVPPYNKQALELLLSKVNEYTIRDKGVAEFLNDLQATGVKFIYLPHLSKTYMDGAAFKSENTPIIALTGRYDRLDNFWFTICHEIIHVLKHLNNENDFFIDDSFSSDEKDEREKEANEMASSALKSHQILQWFRNFYGYLPKEEVLRCSQTLKIHPSSIVGILAFNEKTSWSTIHRFKKSVEDKIPAKYKMG